MAQVVSHQPLAAEFWVRSQASPCSIGAGFLSMAVFLYQCHRDFIVLSVDSVVE